MKSALLLARIFSKSYRKLPDQRSASVDYGIRTTFRFCLTVIVLLWCPACWCESATFSQQMLQGEKFYQSMQLSKATSAFRRAFAEASSPVEKVIAVNAVGDCAFIGKRFSDAESSYREALLICESSPRLDNREVVITMNNLAASLLEQKRSTEAQKTLSKIDDSRNADFFETPPWVTNKERVDLAPIGTIRRRAFNTTKTEFPLVPNEIDGSFREVLCGYHSPWSGFPGEVLIHWVGATIFEKLLAENLSENHLELPGPFVERDFELACGSESAAYKRFHKVANFIRESRYKYSLPVETAGGQQIRRYVKMPSDTEESACKEALRLLFGSYEQNKGSQAH